LFILGFLGMAILNSFNIFLLVIHQSIQTASQFLIVMALAGVGLETDIGVMKKIGLYWMGVR
jgi:uncharacterized membrane protein YadS